MIEACSSNSNYQNPQGTSSDSNSNYQGSGHSSDYEDNYWNGDQESNGDNNQSLCPPCNEYGLLLRHLRTCPEPEVTLPFEIKDLSLNYKEIEESISTIKNTIQVLSTDSLLVEVKKFSDFLTTDMAKISNKLDYIT